MNFYSNLAIGYWGLLMDDLKYGIRDMAKGQKGKLALIDSGNSSIQVPNTIFNNIKDEMQISEPSIYESEIDGNKILVARKSCLELESLLFDIEFTL
jgi:hypothetical protein